MYPVNKLLLTFAIVAMMAAAVATGTAGTLATFTAQTTNPNNTFATGTLVLSNTKAGGSSCLSTGGGATDTNSNAGCDQLLNLTVKKPGDSGTANLTVKNEGSLAASALKLFSGACANADASAESYHGTGNPCSTVQLYVQQFSDSGYTTPSACLYGGASGNTCDFSDAAKTLTAFATAYNSSSTGLTIGAGLAAGASGYFQIGVKLPSSADNTYQGRQATADFSWFAQQ